ncbi:aspartate 1-decarboxylase [Liquorilactobacillus satsumensis]|nr:aspartate 1-decarboxylase [Liquorilactobacillus satsumensis]MCP9361021.1 aspartate 1-decarboxylase [Liquorilactobacillus satsumensis]
MLINLLKGKIHRATVTQAALNYVGSITIDVKLMQGVKIHEYEKGQMADVNNGYRLSFSVVAFNEANKKRGWIVH